MDVFSDVVKHSRPYLRACLAEAGHALGVFAALDGAQQDATSLARNLSLKGSERLEVVLDALVLEGWLKGVGDGRYGLRDVPARPRQVPGAGVGWGALARVIQTGRCEPEPSAGQALERYHEALWRGGEAVAVEVARDWLVDAGRVLDLGGGSGVYSAAYLEAVPEGRITLVDRGPVTRIARQRLARYGERARCVEGDLFEWREEIGWDVVLLANVTHLYSLHDCARLLSHVRALVAPGGIVLIKDFGENDVGRLFSVNMVVYTEGGRVHSREALEQCMVSSGWRKTTCARLLSSPDSMVLCGAEVSAWT